MNTDIITNELGVAIKDDEPNHKKYLKVSNSGIIDPLAFELIGGSTKRGDTSKIGYFGSGLKYSIAYLLRNEIPFVVYAGMDKIEFTTEKRGLRTSEFDAIAINGKVTSLTTQMGIDWELWFAMREIVCNAMDEPGYKIERVETIEPVNDVTSFYIEIVPDVLVILKQWKNYFSEHRTDMLYYTTDGFKIFAGDGKNRIVYRKGIQCHMEEENCLFHYDSPTIEISESRTIRYSWNWSSQAVKLLQECTDKKIIETLFMRMGSGSSVWEKDLSWESNVNRYTHHWLEVVNNRTLIPCEYEGHYSEEVAKDRAKYLVLPKKMCDGLCDRFPEIEYAIGNRKNKELQPFKTVEHTPKTEYLLKDTIKILEEMKYVLKYPVSIVTFLDKTVLGQADIKEQRILLCTRAFDMGRRRIAEILIEENEHLITELGDETRSFQNHWIRLFISEKEERFGIFL